MTDVTDATFETEVVARSEQVPVIVDLWAPWCGPCRVLGPVLEKVVERSGGRVALAKVNVDENPEVAAAFGVQSIPAVYAMSHGEVVDGFIGAQPESAVEALVERLAPQRTEADDLVDAGDEQSLRAALELDPDHGRAVTSLAQLLAERGDAEEALALLARVPESAETRRVAALARLGDGARAVDGGGLEARLDGLLARVKDDDAARQEYLDLLEAMGPLDPRTAEYRRALAARLY